MSLNSTNLKNAIKTKMETVQPTSAIIANATLGQAIQEYISANATITYSWVAASPPPPSTPDPIITFTSGFSSTPVTALLPSLDFTTFIVALSTWLKTIPLTTPKVAEVTDPTFVLTPLLLNPAGMVVSLPSGLSTFDGAMGVLASDIITCIKTLFINPTPATGIHGGVYTGIATMVSIL
jgi:hypothetical protein